MFRNLFTKTLHDKRGFIIGWSIGLSVMSIITVAFFPTIKDQMGELFANVPKALESITGTPDDYKNIAGYVATGVFDLRMPMLTLIMIIIHGLSLSVGEESSGKLYQLLAQPIGRTKIVWQKWLALLVITVVTHIALFLGTLGIIAVIGESMALSKLFIGTLLCALLTLAIGSLTVALGFALGRRGLVTMVVTCYAFGSYLLTSLSAQVSWLEKIETVSIFHYYQASTAIKGDFNLVNIIVLVLLSLAAVTSGAFIFNKRDVGVHNA